MTILKSDAIYIFRIYVLSFLHVMRGSYGSECTVHIPIISYELIDTDYNTVHVIVAVHLPNGSCLMRNFDSVSQRLLNSISSTGLDKVQLAYNARVMFR